MEKGRILKVCMQGPSCRGHWSKVLRSILHVLAGDHRNRYARCLDMFDMMYSWILDRLDLFHFVPCSSFGSQECWSKARWCLPLLQLSWPKPGPVKVGWREDPNQKGTPGVLGLNPSYLMRFDAQTCCKLFHALPTYRDVWNCLFCTSRPVSCLFQGL